MNAASRTEETPPADGTPDGPPAPQPPLRRSRRNKVLSGVCGGLGRHWDLDPVIFRVVLAVLAVAGGVGLIAYGFAWLLIPVEGEEENEGRRLLSGRVEGPALTAVLCALVGCGLFLSMLANGGVMTFTIMLSLAVAGSAYWSRQRRKAEAQGAGSVDPATAQAVADAPPETKAPPARNSPSWWRDPLSKEAKEAAAAGYLWGPADAPPEVTYEPRPGHGYRYDAAEAARSGQRPAARPLRRPRRAGRPIGGWVFLLALSVGAAATAATWPDHPLGASLQAGLAGALIVFGLGLVLSAWVGRTGGGTIFMVVLTAALLACVTVIPKNVSTHVGDRHWAPISADQVRPGYELGVGRGRLDLSGLDFKEGQTVRTKVEVGAGQLQVTVPDGVTTRLSVSVGLGDIRLPYETVDDVEITTDQHETVTVPAKGLKAGEKPHGTLELRLEVGAGQAEIVYANRPGATPTGAPSATPPSPAPAPSVPATSPRGEAR